MINSCTSIKDIEVPKDDARCAAILRTVIRNLKEKESDSRFASSSSFPSSQRYPNKVYALRQKMMERNLLPFTGTDSRTGSSNSISEGQGPNKVYELRKTMVGLGLL